MATPDGLIQVVYNGETYNFREERARLEARGVRFTSGTDTEVALRLYEAHGEACLERMSE